MDNLRMVADLDSRLNLGPRLRRAFLTVDRGYFLPASVADKSRYADHPIPIGHGQTNSQPYTVAFMIKLLEVAPGQRVLDIGCGSGWTTALLDNLSSPNGEVTGLERIDALVAFGRENLRRFGINPEMIQKARVRPGIEGHRYDRILVSAAAQRMPGELPEQIAIGGIMVIPLGSSIWKIQRVGDDTWNREEYPGFRFVPLL
jgi:protein-L-isoaspartate(D-aspartate) O-methyltransferase